MLALEEGLIDSRRRWEPKDIWAKRLQMFGRASDDHSMSSWNIHNRVFATIRALLYDRRYFWHLAGMAFVADAVLTQLIIRYVACALQSSTTLLELNDL
jgi:hypothetical protein